MRIDIILLMLFLGGCLAFVTFPIWGWIYLSKRVRRLPLYRSEVSVEGLEVKRTVPCPHCKVDGRLKVGRMGDETLFIILAVALGLFLCAIGFAVWVLC